MAFASLSKNNYSIYKLAIEKKSKTQPNCEKKYNKIVVAITNRIFNMFKFVHCYFC